MRLVRGLPRRWLVVGLGVVCNPALVHNSGFRVSVMLLSVRFSLLVSVRFSSLSTSLHALRWFVCPGEAARKGDPGPEEAGRKKRSRSLVVERRGRRGELLLVSGEAG